MHNSDFAAQNYFADSTTKTITKSVINRPSNVQNSKYKFQQLQTQKSKKM